MMRAEDIVALAKDAARYRYLRGHFASAIVKLIWGVPTERPDTLDGLIDAEIKQ